jgi:hypothetical protein
MQLTKILNQIILRLSKKIDVMTGKNPEKQFDTMLVLTVAVAAYKMNDNQYLKNLTVESTDYIQESKDYIHKVRYSPNRDIVKYYFCPYEFKNYKNVPAIPEITTEHEKTAQDVKKYISRVVFKILAKDNTNQGGFLGIIGTSYDSYLENLYKVVNQPTVSHFEFGIIASAPTYYYNEKQKEYEREKLENIENKHVGVVGKSIFLENFEVLKIISSKKFGGFVIKGIANNNLFMYYSSNPVSYKIKDVIKISGKIKKHEFDQTSNKNITCLNYISQI